MKIPHHLTMRVAWHDAQWDGTVCRQPSSNPYCVALERIRAARLDKKEDKLASEHWADLDQGQLPPCIAESGGFMSGRPWTRRFKHPYEDNAKAAETHGVLQETDVVVPPHATFAVPFAWMLAENGPVIEARVPDGLPPDERAPFPTAWVFGRARQDALLDHMFGHLNDDESPGPASLVFFYTKEGHPLGDDISRLVAGVGRIRRLWDRIPYESARLKSYPLWDRVVEHSIRLKGHDGFLLPYHDYLRPTGDPEEDERRRKLLDEVIVTVDPAYLRAFSYGSELAGADAALSTLVRCLEAVRAVRRHGVVEGPWGKREDWLNQKIAEVWRLRGPYPGIGAALEAIDLRLGTALVLELHAQERIEAGGDPWPEVDDILRGRAAPPQSVYEADIAAVRDTWQGMPRERRQLLKLLSRFDLTPKQARRWFQRGLRKHGTTVRVSDEEILKNPYRIAETDLGDADDSPVSVGVVDRGLLPDDTIAVAHPVPAPSTVGSPADPRRIRAGLVAVLRDAASTGDSLLSQEEAIERVGKLDVARPLTISEDWFGGNQATLQGVIDTFKLIVDDPDEDRVPAIQLTDVAERERRLGKVLWARAGRLVPSTGEVWKPLIVDAVRAAGGDVDPDNPRHAQALEEQAAALEQLTTRRVSVLTGRAGTGKTAVLGALLRAESIRQGGVLLLAPTGKARVRLAQATDSPAQTVAQWLHGLRRYDGARQRPLFAGERQFGEARTVVVDESSMLTMDDLYAIVMALDLGHVERLVLVGDPNQLPPIGIGRPFADFVATLEDAAESEDVEEQQREGALARLDVELRTHAGAPSDALRLAGTFTRGERAPDADNLLAALDARSTFNDLDIAFWKDAEELRARLVEKFQAHLGLDGPKDTKGFDRALGLTDDGLVPFDHPNGSEAFQILSPVRMRLYGVHELNRWVQGQFRGDVRSAQARAADEQILWRDKVIQLRNEERRAWNGEEEEKHYIANGEVGLVNSAKNGTIRVLFANRPLWRFKYRSGSSERSSPLALAYALTVHKAQGSQFGTVFVVVPADLPHLSRELLYTALTRSRDRLVLLVEGESASVLYDLSKPENSDTTKRNTRLFTVGIRRAASSIPYAKHLIHRTAKGHMVRSKSELFIADTLFHMKLAEAYKYELPLQSDRGESTIRPDFTFVDAAGDRIVWEHLGRLHLPDYREQWEWKREWYERHGFVRDETLFTTEDDRRGGLNSNDVAVVAERIASRL